MATSEDMSKLLQDSKDYLDGKTNAKDASQVLLTEVQDIQKKGKWWDAVREAEYLGAPHFDTVPKVQSIEPDGNVYHPTKQLIITPSIFDLQGKDRKIVISQPNENDPISVQVGHIEKGKDGKHFVVDQQSVINMQDDGKPTVDATKSAGMARVRDDREGPSAVRDLYAPDEAARLAKLSDQVAAREPGAVGKMRNELLRANEQYDTGRAEVFKEYQKMARSPILEADPKSAIMQMKDPVAPANTNDDLFVTAKDTLQSISPEAAIRFSDERSAFQGLVVSMAALSPRDLQTLMKDNGDGTCTVTFPGAPGKPVTVPIPRRDQRPRDDQYRGTWPKVLDTAYEQYLRQNISGFANLSAAQIQQSESEPGAAERAFKALMGKEPVDDHTAIGGYDKRIHIGLDNHGALGKRLQDAVEQGRAGLAYDPESKVYRGILDYDPVNGQLFYDNIGGLGDRDLDEISPYVLGPGYALSIDNIYLRP